MKFKETLKNATLIMLSFMKMGVFSFGGGTAMLSLLRDEFVVKKQYMSDEELAEMTAISESTPGPIAVNLATYLGYKRAGALGSVFATFGVVFPSFVIMFIISLFLQNILQNEWVNYAFMGIKCGVIFLILRVGYSLIRGMQKDWIAISLFVITALLIIAFTIFSINFSAVFYILGGALVGVLYYGLIKAKHEKKKEEHK